MRTYVWYCEEHNAIVFQQIVENCYISFEWSYEDIYRGIRFSDIDPMNYAKFIPLGEL